jgi:hypothetical protein
MSDMDNPLQSDVPAYGASRVQDQLPEEPAKLGPFQRLVGIIFSPGETFADVNRKPTVITPIVIAVAMVVASTIFFSWWVKPDWDRILRPQVKQRIERGGQTATEEQIQQGVEFGKIFAKFTPVIVAVFVPIFYVALAGIFALGMMFIQAKATFKKILSVVAWGGAVTALISAIVSIVVLLLQDKEALANIDPTKSSGIAPTNLDAILTGMSVELPATIKAVASSLDIFSIWYIFLLAIGLAAIAGSRKITASKTGGMVFGLWAIYVLVKVGFAAMFG